MTAPNFPRYCRAALGGSCRDKATAARRARDTWSREFRASGLQRERRLRAEARRLGCCAHCGRDTRHGAALEHRTFEDCARRYPALVTSLAWILCGSESEAACCIRDARDRMRFGAEVVSHSGLAPMDRVQHAVRAWGHAGTRRMLSEFYRARRAARAALILEVVR